MSYKNYKRGGLVPGVSKVPGNSPLNDTVKIKASPGEIIVPRSHSRDPEKAKRFVEDQIKKNTLEKMAKGGTVDPELEETDDKDESNGNVTSPTKTNTETGGSSPGGASTGGVGSGIGGAGTGGAATGGASTGGAGTITVTVSGKSKVAKGAINISGVGGKTGNGEVTSGDGPGSSGSGGTGKGSGGGGGGGGADEPSDSPEFSDGGSVKSEADKPWNQKDRSDFSKGAKSGGTSASDAWKNIKEGLGFSDGGTVKDKKEPTKADLIARSFGFPDAGAMPDKKDKDKEKDRGYWSGGLTGYDASGDSFDGGEESEADYPVSAESGDEEPELDLEANSTPAKKPMDAVLSKYLENKSNLLSAQKESSQRHLNSGMTRAFSQLANSGYGNTNKPDEGIANELEKNADAPIEQEKERQGIEENDPKSQKANDLRKVYQYLLKKNGMDASSLDSMGVTDMQKYGPVLEHSAKLNAMKDSKELAANAQKASKEEKAKEKATMDQSKAYRDYSQRVATARGNSAVQQAGLGILAAEKALPLINKKNPTAQDLSLLAHEMGKIATGGVPGEHGVQSLVPDNLLTKIAKIKEWATGNPNASTADVKQYIENNREYLNEVLSVSKKKMHDFQTGILKGYKRMLHPDDLKEAEADIESQYGASKLDRSPSDESASSGEIKMKDPKTGKIGVFDSQKKFVRWE